MKQQHVNLRTSPADLLDIMRKEMSAAIYHFRKHYGGVHRYKAYEDQVSRRVMEEKVDAIVPAVEYVSPAGNRWFTYAFVCYNDVVKGVNIFKTSFIYYETIGSCGAVFPFFDDTNDTSKSRGLAKDFNGAVIFTSHFFRRFAERTGIPYRTTELVMRFIEDRGVVPDDTQDNEIAMRLNKGYAFGVVKQQAPRVIEIRTYLTDQQLSPSQRARIKALKAYHELIKDSKLMSELCRKYSRKMTAAEIMREGDRLLRRGGSQVAYDYSLSLYRFALGVATNHYHLDYRTISLANVAVAAIAAHHVFDPIVDEYMRSYAGQPTMSDVEFGLAVLDAIEASHEFLELGITRERAHRIIDNILASPTVAESMASDLTSVNAPTNMLPSMTGREWLKTIRKI